MIPKGADDDLKTEHSRQEGRGARQAAANHVAFRLWGVGGGGVGGLGARVSRLSLGWTVYAPPPAVMGCK